MGLSHPYLYFGILVVLLGLGIFLAFFSDRLESFLEPFEDSQLATGLQDRLSPLAALQDPLANPAVAIGVSKGDAQRLREMNTIALNSYVTTPTEKDAKLGLPVNPLSPRIDDESSLLGMVKFCKEKGADPNAWADPKFAANCGICMSSGSLISGESFSEPTGVYVAEADKAAAKKKQELNGYAFPHVIPSFSSANCQGSSTGQDAKPVLAVSKEDFMRFGARARCAHDQTFGGGCAICQSTKVWSYIDPQTAIRPLTLLLWGQGLVQVSLDGKPVAAMGAEAPAQAKQAIDEAPAAEASAQAPAAVQLSGATPTVFVLGRSKEGTKLSITCVKGNSYDGPLLYGIIQSKLPNDKEYKLPIEKFLLKDTQTGSTPRKMPAKLFPPAKLFLAELRPAPNGEQMVLEGNLPVTFVEPDQLPAYDCQDAPFTQSLESAEMLLDDPCLKSNQGPGNYSEDCLRAKVLEGGCLTEGSWYQNPRAVAGQMSIGEFVKWVRSMLPFTSKDAKVAAGCTGEDITTPCDEFLTSNRTPNKACLRYLYEGPTGYMNASPDYTSMNTKKQEQFCQPGGSLNPDTAEGEAALLRAAAGYKGYQGVEAVKQYLSDTYNRATSELDIALDDEAGGRKQSWQKCFGVPIASWSQQSVR